MKKVFNFEIKQIGEETDRILRFVGSDETPDRDNDIIEVGGWKLDEFLKNPVFMWAHRYDQPPIGKAVNVTIDAISRKLLFDIKFPTKEEYEFADTIYNLYKGGYLNATSVGFKGVKFKTRDDESVLEKPEWQRGRRYMEQNLLELSAVPVPCNPNALMSVRSKGFKDEDIDQIFISEEIKFNKDTKTLTIFDNEGNEKTITLELLQGLSEDHIKSLETNTEKLANLTDFMVKNNIGNPGEDCIEVAIKCLSEKSGATLSAKNKKLLNDVHDKMDSCRQDLRKFIDETNPVQEEEGEKQDDENELLVKLQNDMESFKTSIEEIKTLVNSLKPIEKEEDNDANKDVDLDAIESPTAEKDAEQDELDIEPEEIKNLVQSILEQQLKGGN